MDGCQQLLFLWTQFASFSVEKKERENLGSIVVIIITIVVSMVTLIMVIEIVIIMVIIINEDHLMINIMVIITSSYHHHKNNYLMIKIIIFNIIITITLGRYITSIVITAIINIATRSYCHHHVSSPVAITVGVDAIDRCHHYYYCHKHHHHNRRLSFPPHSLSSSLSTESN